MCRISLKGFPVEPVDLPDRTPSAKAVILLKLCWTFFSRSILVPDSDVGFDALNKVCNAARFSEMFIAEPENISFIRSTKLFSIAS